MYVIASFCPDKWYQHQSYYHADLRQKAIILCELGPIYLLSSIQKLLCCIALRCRHLQHRRFCPFIFIFTCSLVGTEHACLSIFRRVFSCPRESQELQSKFHKLQQLQAVTNGYSRFQIP